MATKVSFVHPIRSAFQQYRESEFNQLFEELRNLDENPKIEPHMYDVCNGLTTTIFIENLKSFGKDRILVAANNANPTKAKDEALIKLQSFLKAKKNVVGKTLFKADPAHGVVAV